MNWSMIQQVDEFTSDPIDTGITATVKSELTPVALDALKAMIHLPSNLDPVELAKLARDIATSLDTTSTVLRRYNLTQAHYEFLCQHNHFFKNILETQIKEWQGVKSTQERVRLQAALATELILPGLTARINTRTEELRDAVEGAKYLAKVAGVDNPDRQAGAPGERFTITIDLGADKIVVGTSGPSSEGSAPTATGAAGTDADRTIDLVALPTNGETP